MRVFGKQTIRFMMEENKKCIICEGKRLKKINFGFSFFRRHFDENHKKYFCEECCLVQILPSPSQDYLNFLYSDLYRENINYLNKKDEISIEFDWTSVSYKRFHNLKSLFLKNRLNKDDFTSILDLGGYQGAFAFAMKQFFELTDITVADYDEYGLKLAQKYFDLKVCPIDKIFSRQKKFKIISIVHVLEHLKNPLGHLNSISNILDDDGIIYIEVPNNINFPFSDKTHLFEFSPFSLKKILDISKLRIIDMNINGYPEISTQTYVNNSNISLLLTKESNTSFPFYEKQLNKLSIWKLKINHFINDQKLIFKSLYRSLKLFLKMILYFVFSIISFVLPKISNYMLLKLSRPGLKNYK